MSNAPRIRILLVDDQEVIRVGLRAGLGRQADMEVVAEARNGPEAIACYRSLRPDVVLMALRLPGMNGVETLRALREEFPEVRALILSAYDLEEDIYQAMQTGAFGYLLKTASLDEIAQSIREVFAGHKAISSRVAWCLSERLTRNELTRRETKVLELIVAGYGNREISKELHISEGTVKSHVNSLLGKMEVTDRTQAAVQAIRSGMVHLKPLTSSRGRNET